MPLINRDTESSTCTGKAAPMPRMAERAWSRDSGWSSPSAIATFCRGSVGRLVSFNVLNTLITESQSLKSDTAFTFA